MKKRIILLMILSLILSGCSNFRLGRAIRNVSNEILESERDLFGLEVINVTGHNACEALEELRDSGFTNITLIGADQEEDLNRFMVIWQSVKPKERRLKKEEILLKIGLTVIDVNGKNLSQAIDEMNAVGFTNITFSGVDEGDDLSRYEVIEQNITPGVSILCDQEIVLTCKKICHIRVHIERTSGGMIVNYYDLEILLDNKLVGFIGRGEKFDETFTVLEGEYELMVRVAGNITEIKPSIFNLSIDDDCFVKFKISTAFADWGGCFKITDSAVGSLNVDKDLKP